MTLLEGLKKQLSSGDILLGVVLLCYQKCPGDYGAGSTWGTAGKGGWLELDLGIVTVEGMEEGGRLGNWS